MIRITEYHLDNNIYEVTRVTMSDPEFQILQLRRRIPNFKY